LINWSPVTAVPEINHIALLINGNFE